MLNKSTKVNNILLSRNRNLEIKKHIFGIILTKKMFNSTKATNQVFLEFC